MQQPPKLIRYCPCRKSVNREIVMMPLVLLNFRCVTHYLKTLFYRWFHFLRIVIRRLGASQRIATIFYREIKEVMVTCLRHHFSSVIVGVPPTAG